MPDERRSLEGLLNDAAVSDPLKAVLLAWWGRDPLDAADDAAALAAVMGERATDGLDTALAFDRGKDRLLDWARVGRLTGLGRSTVWRMRKSGHFPQPASISPGRVAWRERDIYAWIRTRDAAAFRRSEPIAPKGDEVEGKPATEK